MLASEGRSDLVYSNSERYKDFVRLILPCALPELELGCWMKYDAPDPAQIGVGFLECQLFEACGVRHIVLTFP